MRKYRQTGEHGKTGKHREIEKNRKTVKHRETGKHSRMTECKKQDRILLNRTGQNACMRMSAQHGITMLPWMP